MRRRSLPGTTIGWTYVTMRPWCAVTKRDLLLTLRPFVGGSDVNIFFTLTCDGARGYGTLRIYGSCVSFTAELHRRGG
jgi:hypothetical protein